ncbi:MAG: 2-oxoacid:acceptor oxidoreductase family protein [Chloroflexi bacterium]|nr:2-oxoacid:acceptor oxidoreductase family protein [Chloroflexota bacterium]
MQTEIIISGFGGQGALFAGQLLAYAAMDEGKHVTWIPSYGPEMRGGTAHCTVIISDDEIGSPLVRNPAAVIAMNMPSLDKYESLVAPGGVLVINSSLTAHAAARTDIHVIEVPANAIAEELGSATRSVANLVLAGAMLAATNALPLEAVEQALEAHLPERHRKLLGANREALRRGAALAEIASAEKLSADYAD